MNEIQEIIRLLEDFQVLGLSKHLVLVGSWCLLVYCEAHDIPRPVFTTNDIDFSVKNPKHIPSLPVFQYLKDLGYQAEHSLLGKSERYIPAPLSENHLNIEFLCRQGRGLKDPTPFKNLGISLTPLAYQEYLLENTTDFYFQGIPVTAPAPEIWAAHKIAISQLRKGRLAIAKQEKDLEGAKIIMEWLGEKTITRAAESFSGKKFITLFYSGINELKKIFPF